MRPSNNLENPSAWQLKKYHAVSNQFQMGKQEKRYWSHKDQSSLKKVVSKQFCFIRCRRHYVWVVEQRSYSRSNFVQNIISNSPKVIRAKFWESDGLFCFICIHKFGSFKNSFATITSFSKLYFRFRRYIVLVHTECFSLTYDLNGFKSGNNPKEISVWQLDAALCNI